jgi:hypothetical protein
MRKYRRVATGDAEYHVTDGQQLVGTVRLVNDKYQASPATALCSAYSMRCGRPCMRSPRSNQTKRPGRVNTPAHDKDQPDEPFIRKTGNGHEHYPHI